MTDIERKILLMVRPQIDQVLAEFRDALLGDDATGTILVRVVEHMKGRSTSEFKEMLEGIGCAFIFRLLDEIEEEL